MENIAVSASQDLRIDKSLRIEIALNAIEAVHELCSEIATCDPRATLGHVGAENFACLLMLINDDLRDALANDGEGPAK